MISYASLLNFVFWLLGLFLMILLCLACERGRTLCVCFSCESGFLFFAISYLLDWEPSSPGTKHTVSNNNSTQLSLLLWNDRLNKRQSSVCLLWLTCCLELQSLCPILFKSNMSGDLATGLSMTLMCILLKQGQQSELESYTLGNSAVTVAQKIII